MSTISTMQEDDLDRVIEIEAAVFGAWYKQMHGGEGDVPRRTRANVCSCLVKDPAGCFVAQEDDQIVGFILSRTWGSVGWFGTFSVLSEWQGQEIGKQLVAASLDYLRRRPGRVIGPPTMPESSYNLGLYLKLGFQRGDRCAGERPAHLGTGATAALGLPGRSGHATHGAGRNGQWACRRPPCEPGALGGIG
jgi:ribosomal protein S18 acetylase RimI-like enzyme